MINQSRNNQRRNSLSTDTPSAAVRLVGGAVILTAIYLAAVAGDGILSWRQRSIDQDTARRYAEASAIEAMRFQEQDIPQIQAAVADGYAQNLYLSTFDSNSRYRALAQKHAIAPLAPQPHSKLLYCNEGYGLVRYHSDRYGFRNDDSTWDSKQPDAVLIGDSFVHGACVGQDETISGQLIQKGRTVLNLGTGGNGPLHYAALAQTFLPRASPRFAVVFFHPNDNLDETGSVYREFFFGNSGAQYFAPQQGPHRPSAISASLAALYGATVGMLRYPSPGAELKPASLASKQGAQIPFFERVKRALQLTELRQAIGSALAGLGLKREPPWSTRLAVDTTVANCQRPACTPIFVYLANSDYWSPDYRAEGYKRTLKEYVESRAGNAQFLDTSQGLSALGMKGFAPAGKHYSPDGYAAVSRAVEEAMALQEVR